MYPAIEPFEAGWLPTGDGHDLYWELCGNPEGIPAVFLHGGPGAGSPEAARRLFDPQRYRLLLFDQRGSGRSRPLASLDKNTTWSLVADLELLRRHIGVDRWLLFGGSWGTTLALAYAQHFPERVSGLILRGIFTGRREEIDWIYRGGAGRIFPEAWDAFVGSLDARERLDPVSAYHRQLNHPDKELQTAAARRWSRWEAAIVQLIATDEVSDAYSEIDFALALARIESHYIANGFWLEEGQILCNVHAIAHLPATIVQGRYDMCTPPRAAWELHRAWPNSRLIMTTAGHRFDERETLTQLLNATDEFASRLGS